MLEIECYFNPKKPGLLLYLRYGEKLADVEGMNDADDWVFSSTVSDKEVPRHLQDEIRATGHAFQHVRGPD